MQRTSSRAGSVARRLGAILVLAGVGVLALAQVLAWTSPQWWVPVLRWAPGQYVVVASGALRDALGAWTIVAALLLLVAATAPHRARGAAALRRPVTVVAVLVTISSTALWIHQVRDARALGVDVGGFAPVVPFTQGTVPVDRELVLARVGDTELTAQLTLPRGRADGTAPVVVRVHGGGFTSGAPAPSPLYPPLLDAGYAVLDVSYRLASPQKQTWDEAVADVGCALTWITTSGPDAGLDPRRVALLGESAGGQLVINAANLTSRGSLEPSCGSAADLPRIGAVMAAYPAVDGEAAYEQTALGAAYGDQYVGGPAQEFPERYAFTDSINHLGPDGAPLLIVQGAADHLILPGPVRDFAAASRAAGTVTEYVELPGQEHTTGGGLGTLSFGELVSRQLTLRWFDRHL